MLFIDKKQLKEDIEDYRIYNGYGLKTVKSDTSRLYLVCKAEGCEWTLFASRLQAKKSFQNRNMSNPHTCVPYSLREE